jgi:hypothetical protein
MVLQPYLLLTKELGHGFRSENLKRYDVPAKTQVDHTSERLNAPVRPRGTPCRLDLICGAMVIRRTYE